MKEYNNWNWDGNPDDYFGFIYRITEITTGRMYIGKKQFRIITRKQIPDRKNRVVIHKESNWRTYTSSSKYLNEAIKLNGIKNYNFEIISLHYSKGALHYAEVELQVKEDVLRKKFSDGTPMYYNRNIAGTKFIPPDEITDEHRFKISAANKGKIRTTEFKENVSKFHTGRKRSDETCAKMSKATKGVPKSEEHKANCAKANLGKVRSLEAIEKTRLKNTGQKRSDETKANMSIAQTGRIVTDEHKLKMSEIAKKRPIVKCPYCDKEASLNAMKQHHFDNCKQKPVLRLIK